MSPIRLAVVLAAPLLFAVLPLLSLVVPWGGVRTDVETGTPSIVSDVTTSENEEAATVSAPSRQRDAFAYATEAKAQRDCSLSSKAHIDG